MTRLQFSIRIDAPRERVWNTMLGEETYRAWTRAFCEGSFYEGSWEAGARIRFLSPEGGGMTAVIAESRPHEFVSIKHLGFVKDGVDDTESESVRAWAPAYENYSFRSVGAATEVRVDLDMAEEWEQYMREAWPKALAGLKALCEAG